MFDGAINTNNFEFYNTLLKITRNNDTGECPIRGTFFMIHNYNNYAMTEYFYSKGHEIAVSSVTGQSLQFANETTWRKEVTKMKEYLERFASIPQDEVLGVRAPRLKPGFDDQFKVIVEEGFVWDSSVSTKGGDTADYPIWPYTLDYRIPHKCKIDSCPTKAYPGLWEIPANIHQVDDQSGGQCSYLDQCVFAHFDETDVFNWLKEDFLRFYDGNRAPYTLPFHTNWFTHPHQVKGLIKFVRWTLALPDPVYYLTATEVLLWMSEPTDEVLKELTGQCNELGRPAPCRAPTTCKLAHEQNGVGEFRYMSTCNECPNDYPWIDNYY